MKVIKQNSVGYFVYHLQYLLKCWGYSYIELDGIYDQDLTQIVKDIQFKFGLVIDGIVGQNTWDKLNCITNMNKINESDYQEIANKLNIEVATIKSVKEVESGKYSGFIQPGMPPILFEGHIFWNQLKKNGIDPNTIVSGNEDILYPKWTKKYYLGGLKEYDRLDKALKINQNAALQSASWGMFQIMGFNYKACGCTSIDEFISRMKRSERDQLEMFMQFLISNRWDKYLREKDWAGFASKYNGPAYKENQYDIKLERSYNKYKKEA